MSNTDRPGGIGQWSGDVSPDVRAHNIMTAHDESGHMVYIDRPASANMHADLVKFYKATEAEK
ncbi:MAG TPA: hypothetical protein VL484_19180 [Vicinamibacterales bacterium]|jgi:carboxypeptidase C (cathepsin A)|nr:hypothetical protein [Vicinamibacterales bacterium]